MGTDQTPQHQSTTLTLPACPACASANPAIAFATRTKLYLLCQVCDHVWQSGRPWSEDHSWTSIAFRVTRRMLAPRAN
jgi:hypothetical protein